MATPARSVFSHITKDPRVCGGSACIDQTRVRVIDVVEAHREGKSPEQIRELFAVKLTLAQVYSALAYADENRQEIDAEYTAHEKGFADGLRARDDYLKGPSRT